MKRSKQLKLVLMGSLLAATTVLTGCDEEASPQNGETVVTTLAQCQKLRLGPTQCQDSYSTSWTNHVNQSEKYWDQYACETVYVKCTALSVPEDDRVDIYWMPDMLGFIPSQDSDQSRPVYLTWNMPNSSSSTQVVAGPNNVNNTLYVLDVALRTTLDHALSNSLTVVRSSAVAQPAVASSPRAAVSVARGGFGAAGRGMSSGG